MSSIFPQESALGGMGLGGAGTEDIRQKLSASGPIPNAVLYNNAKDLAAAMVAGGVVFGGGGGGVPVGTILHTGQSVIPAGFLDCDGSSQLRSLYPDLFDAIGVTYGPGAVPGTTFALPTVLGTYGNFVICADVAAIVVDTQSLIGAPIGTLLLYAVSPYPTGWLRADGTAISRTTYADLFAILGTTYGVGDGSTTFNLPNLLSSGSPSPVYIIKVALSGSVEPSTVAHASSHIRAGTDVIDGDRVQVDYVPSAYTRNAAASGAGAVTDLTAHLDGINTLAGQGHIVCTSSTRPTSPATGTMIYETDTQRLLVYNGTSWITIPSADDEAYAYIYHNSVVAFPAGNTKIPWSVIPTSKNVSLSSGSIIFAKAGVYEFNVGFRFGTGTDDWTGVNLFNASTSSILAYGYGVGQVAGNDPAGASWQFLANITSTTNSHDIRVYRNTSTMTTAVPNANAGWTYTLTVKRLSSS